jgi:hypothetical protein
VFVPPTLRAVQATVVVLQRGGKIPPSNAAVFSDSLFPFVISSSAGRIYLWTEEEYN